jgi:N-acetylmuramoyl-L-alanine amidase
MTTTEPTPHPRGSAARPARIALLAGVLAALVGCSQAQASPPQQRPEPTSGSTTGPTGYVRPDAFPVDPGEFASGACVSFGPTSGHNHRTVFLDAGHGGIDPGALGVTESGKTIHEADETLAVELDAMVLLRAAGYRVVVSRTGDSNVARLGAADLAGGVLSAAGVHADVAARDVCANRAGATILIGIYFNAGASAADAGSITGYDTARPFAADNLRLATLVQHDVLASLNSRGWQIPDDGVVSDATLGGPPLTAAAARYGHLLLLGPADAPWFTTPSQMPGALIEPLFITDPFEGTVADGRTGQQAIAHGIAEAVEQHFAAS